MPDSTDWEARANREAAAIVMEASGNAKLSDYSMLLRFVAIGWLQGHIAGSHETLNEAEHAFQRLQEDLR